MLAAARLSNPLSVCAFTGCELAVPRQSLHLPFHPLTSSSEDTILHDNNFNDDRLLNSNSDGLLFPL